MKQMNNIDKQYQALLQDIIDNGVEKKDRTGTGTISVFGRQIRHKMSEGFPLLTTKKMAWKTMVTELVWFLSGSTNIKYLVENNCHIWDGDAYKRFYTSADDIKCAYENGEMFGTQPHISEMFSDDDKLIILTKEEFINKIKTDDEFAKVWGELGPIYGKQWRNWNGVDQIQNLINDLKTNPDSRRLMVNAWNVGELDEMVLPPCHYGFQLYTRELTFNERVEIGTKKGLWKLGQTITPLHCDSLRIPTRELSLMWNQRSVDTFLGLPFNIASYGLLLMMLADEALMVPGELIGNLGDVHLYSNHIEAAKEQIGRLYTSDERSQMLKEAMGYENYNKAVEDLMPFGGGLSEYYEIHKIPYHTREPFPLPTVHVRDGIYSFGTQDVILENYQSHPTIKAPLSN